MEKIKSHNFMGKRYKIDFNDNPLFKKFKCVGICDKPSTIGKTINISSHLSELSLMTTAIHEGIHACIWDIDDLSVRKMSVDISNFLYRLGFGKINKNNKTKRQNYGRKNDV
jgi:hypothetical protein